MIAFNNTLQDFGYTQTLEPYNSYTYQAHPPPQNPLFQYSIDTVILDSSPSNPSQSAPYSPDRITTTPNNTPILQTQTTTTRSQNLPFLETNSSASDSCDELLSSNVQDTSSIINRHPLSPIRTTRTLHVPEPGSVLLTLAPVHTEYQLPQKQLEKLLCQHYQKILLYRQQVKLQLKLYQNIQPIHHLI